jgi:hypothetical protein
VTSRRAARQPQREKDLPCTDLFTAFSAERAPTVIGAALLSGAVLPAAGLWAGTASAAPTCTLTAGVTTCTFTYAGHATNFQVPVGVTALAVVADGGAAANAVSSYIHGGGNGGLGGEYKAMLTGVTPGSTLSIFPGGTASSTAGGAGAGGGGGSGATDLHGTSGGGGQSTVSIAPSRSATSSWRPVAGAPTHLTPNIVFKVLQTFTVSGTLTSFDHPVAGALLTFRTGPFTLCHAFTNSHGIGFCVLTYNQSLLIRQQAGRYRVSYAGSPGYFPSIWFGQAIIHP